ASASGSGAAAATTADGGPTRTCRTPGIVAEGRVVLDPAIHGRLGLGIDVGDLGFGIQTAAGPIGAALGARQDQRAPLALIGRHGRRLEDAFAALIVIGDFLGPRLDGRREVDQVVVAD